ncbi:pannexin-1-like isoform X1 [Alosa sapidissima]|uniref:pannexin-1-like isoform X1 n=1 Tax=Alosa sapidissima TaxID=34773 RepID=UPI001C0A540C|nr:pannexin-1-like isoform X1 [Alosa sapidissima]
MAIAHVATEYVFSDFLLKESPEAARYKGIRLELTLDKMVTCIAVGLPLVLISLAFAQEVSVGTQISCFSPSNFSWRQAAYVDAYCWAAVQKQHLTDGPEKGLPLWLHKFFPYILLLVAVCVYIPALFWHLAVAPPLYSDITFILQEFDQSYNRAINLATRLASSQSDTHGSVLDLTDSWFKYPLVEQYLLTKRGSRVLLLRYVLCRVLTLLILLMAVLYLSYYIRLSSQTDEFSCSIRTGILRNSSDVPAAFPCKLVAVGIFQLLSVINVCVYGMLMPVCVYATLVPLRQSHDFLSPFQLLPTLEVMTFDPAWDDLSLFLLLLEANIGQLKSYKCLKVLEMLKRRNEQCDVMLVLQNLGQVKSDITDGKRQVATEPPRPPHNSTEMKELSPLLSAPADSVRQRSI